ncbi:hypothetical protein VTI28DRAFT_7725 [Corynascus sepedonium]
MRRHQQTQYVLDRYRSLSPLGAIEVWPPFISFVPCDETRLSIIPPSQPGQNNVTMVRVANIDFVSGSQNPSGPGSSARTATLSASSYDNVDSWDVSRTGNVPGKRRNEEGPVNRPAAGGGKRIHGGFPGIRSNEPTGRVRGTEHGPRS